MSKAGRPRGRLRHAALRGTGLALRVAVTTAMLALVLRSIDGPGVWKTLEGARPELLAAALALQLASSAAAAWRWYLVARNLRFGGTAGFYFRSFFKGLFFNQALPGVGGDAFRVIDVARRGCRKRDALYAVFLDRLFGFAVLTALSLLAVVLDPGLLPAGARRALALSMTAGVAAASTIFWVGNLPWPRRPARLAAFLATISQRARDAVAAHRAAVLASSVLSPLFAILCFFVTGRSLGLEYGFLAYVVVVPPALVASALPVSIAGWGVREGTLVGLFALAGADRVAVLTLSLLYGVMVLLASLPGLVIFVGGRQNRAKDRTAP